jgi:hypothetical protein
MTSVVYRVAAKKKNGSLAAADRLRGFDYYSPAKARIRPPNHESHSP